MSRSFCIFFVSIMMVTPFQLMAVESAIPERLEAYKAAGVKLFSAENGQKMWNQQHIAADASKRSCQTCHGPDLSQAGEHARSGKVIDPMALSASPNRYTDTKKVEKWFRRNCKWTLGRVCTPQEKGDFLLFLQSQ